jgi:hypothetical protein
MWPLHPALMGIKGLAEKVAGKFSPFRALWIPGAFDRFGTIRKRVLVEYHPLAATDDGSRFSVNDIDPMRSRILLMRLPPDSGVERLVSGAVFWRMSRDGMDGGENRSEGQVSREKGARAFPVDSLHIRIKEGSP